MMRMMRVVLVPTCEMRLALDRLSVVPSPSVALAIMVLKSMKMSNTSIRVEKVATKSSQKKNEPA